MSKAPLTIIQTGTYSSKNKGDAAMELSTAQCLRDELAAGRILINTPFPRVDRWTYPGCEILPSSRRRLVWGSLKVARAFAWSWTRRRLGLDLGLLLRDRELQAFAAADLIVDLSGDMLTEDYGPHVAYSHYLPILMGIALERPVALCAQSVGPFKWTGRLAKLLFERAQVISVRDEISRDYLRQLGVTNPNLHTTADMAFLLAATPRARARELLAAEGCQVGSQPLLGVSLSGLVAEHYRRRNRLAKQVGFEALFAGLLDSFAGETGAQVLLVPHVTGPSRAKDDRRMGRAVAARMRQPAVALGGDYDPSDLKGIVALTDLFMGARMHANIAALSSAVPTVAIAYSHKTRGIMELLGQGEQVVEIATLSREQLLSQLRRAWAERRAMAALLAERIEEVRAAARRNIDLILAPLRARGDARP